MTFAHDALLTLYGASWCPHCKRVKRFLAAHRVPYDNVDIDAEPEAIERVKQLQGGGQIIPTVVYPPPCSCLTRSIASGSASMSTLS